MLYTLCQRLIADPKIGFNYDYMGAAEYEFGGTREARKHLYKNRDQLTRVFGRIKTGVREGFDCQFIYATADAEPFAEMANRLASGDYHNKGAMAYSHRPPLGWLILSPVPALVFIQSVSNEERAVKFLNHGTEMFNKEKKP